MILPGCNNVFKIQICDWCCHFSHFFFLSHIRSQDHYISGTDPVGQESAQIIGAGDVFQASNNTFTAVNTFNSNVVLGGNSFINATNFLNSTVAGTIQSDAGGTNTYIHGALKIGYLDDGGGRGYLFPRGVLTFFTSAPIPPSTIGDVTWANVGNTNAGQQAEGRIALLRGKASGTTTNDTGGAVEFYTKQDGGGSVVLRATLDENGVLYGNTSTSSGVLSNWNAKVISFIDSGSSIVSGTALMSGATTISNTLTVTRNLTANSNIISRSAGVVVSGISATTNSLIQIFSGTYGGAVTNITFPITFAAAPSVFITTTDSGGTTVLNDAPWVTNITTSSCVIGYRTAGGLLSGASLNFNGLAVGRQ